MAFAPKMLEYRFNYRRNLPHYQPEQAALFLTFRLAGSIPMVVLRQLAEEHEQAVAALKRQPESAKRDGELYLEQRRAFGKWDAALDALTTARAGLRISESPNWSLIACTIGMAESTIWTRSYHAQPIEAISAEARRGKVRAQGTRLHATPVVGAAAADHQPRHDPGGGAAGVVGPLTGGFTRHVPSPQAHLPVIVAGLRPRPRGG